MCRAQARGELGARIHFHYLTTCLECSQRSIHNLFTVSSERQINHFNQSPLVKPLSGRYRGDATKKGSFAAARYLVQRPSDETRETRVKLCSGSPQSKPVHKQASHAFWHDERRVAATERGGAPRPTPGKTGPPSVTVGSLLAEGKAPAIPSRRSLLSAALCRGSQHPP